MFVEDMCGNYLQLTLGAPGGGFLLLLDIGSGWTHRSHLMGNQIPFQPERAEPDGDRGQMEGTYAQGSITEILM